jgi:hypothetical protein
MRLPGFVKGLSKNILWDSAFLPISLNFVFIGLTVGYGYNDIIADEHQRQSYREHGHLNL